MLACGGGPLTMAVLLLLSVGCASTPSSRFHAAALAADLEPLALQASGYRLQVFHNSQRAGSSLHARGALHIYFGGDGTPWIDNAFVARDPTARKPVVLRLLQMDRQPAVYLGRPCYHRIEHAERCSSNLWTHERYSETVVASMAMATSELIAAAEAANVTLIGFSGGGVLALLVAQRLTGVSTVITLAANLDTHAWTRHHGVRPLTGSINPADISNWRADLRQVHYIGALDSTVPPESRAEFRARVPQAVFITLPDVDHNCCWHDHWQDILKRMD